MSRCKSCGADVLFARNPKSKTVKIDARADETGTLVLFDTTPTMPEHMKAWIIRREDHKDKPGPRYKRHRCNKGDGK